ncbi:YchJ family metal-binding protein [Rhizobium sp. BG4]|jgi:SEC-C motif-containing protein|nr:YchJ family metal-binding protein [Rhizobium sp. BG4]
MRARYTAFTRGDLDFIERTCTDDGKSSLDRFEMERSLPKTTFLGFELREATEEPERDTGSVTFAFRYRFQDKEFTQVEIANFRRVDGIWLFNDSVVNPKPATIRVESIGRNEPCPCGSGKKYKKCCGANA